MRKAPSVSRGDRILARIEVDQPGGLPKPAVGTTISVVIPALNEKEGIAQTISSVPMGELEEMGYGVQVLVVDNGSTDGTADLAMRAGADVVCQPKRGYGSALKAGFAEARGDIIVTGDADGTYPLHDIPRLVGVLVTENLDFLTTNRFALMDEGAMSGRNRLGNAVLSLATRVLFRIDLLDSQSGMWVFRKVLLNRLSVESDSMAFSQELKIEACCSSGCRWKEVPINYRPRLGKVKLKVWRDGFGNLFQLIRKRARSRFTIEGPSAN